MGKNKLYKFNQLATYPHVYQNYNVQDPKLTDYRGEIVDLKNNWRKEHFKNDNPITLELACGRGEYTVALGRQFPDRNFVGIDIKGARIWKGATMAKEERLNNVAFVRTRIEQLALFFGKEEVDEIWITFPDPYLREGKARKRLTSPRFLNIYKEIVKPNAFLHLKTDNQPLYEYTLETLAEENCNIIYHNDDIYKGELYCEELAIKTYYEGLHLENNLTIKYIRFQY